MSLKGECSLEKLFKKFHPRMLTTWAYTAEDYLFSTDPLAKVDVDYAGMLTRALTHTKQEESKYTKQK